MRFSLKGKGKQPKEEVKNVLTEEGEKENTGENLTRQTPLVLVEDKDEEVVDNKQPLCIIPAKSNNSLAETPTEQDYAKLPPGVFGLALLRGMQSQSKNGEDESESN